MTVIPVSYTHLDPLIDCRNCKARHRADNLIEDQVKGLNVTGLPNEEMMKIIKEYGVKCTVCGLSLIHI